MNGWPIVVGVWAVLLLFWIWLGKVFDLISDWHAAARREEQKR